MFRSEYIVTSIFLLIIWIVCAIVSYVPQIVISETFKKLGFKERDILLNVVMFVSVGMISHFSTIITEIKVIGRKYYLLIFFSFGAIFLLAAVLAPLSFPYLLSVSMIFNSGTYNVISTYSNEYFPTKIRETTMGILNFATRTGGFASQFLGVELDKISIFMPYYTICGISIFGALICAFLPHDTYGHHLDLNIDKEEYEKLQSKREN